MARGGRRRLSRDETALERRSRLARERDLAEAARQPPVTDEARQHGDYHEAWTEVDGARRRVLINRGGSTIARWLNAPVDDVLGDSERAAILYCQSLWSRLDYQARRLIRVDGEGNGVSEHEALAELAELKRRIPAPYWAVFEDICRWELPASSRRDRLTVAFVAGLIATWRGL